MIRKELKKPPFAVTSQHGKVGASDKILKVRGRVSIF
jgi:hypothetical protein